MEYRTKTYIAGDWTGDKEAIDKLYEWKNNNRLNLDFVDAHEYTQASDDDQLCSIKASLRRRLNVSKTFVLIVGKQTKILTKGGCQFCKSYNSYNQRCCKNNNVDYRSYIEYECEMAIKDYQNGLIKKIVVIYNYANVDKSKCPDCIKNYGKHIVMYYKTDDGKEYWNYSEIKKEICD